MEKWLEKIISKLVFEIIYEYTTHFIYFIIEVSHIYWQFNIAMRPLDMYY